MNIPGHACGLRQIYLHEPTHRFRYGFYLKFLMTTERKSIILLICYVLLLMPGAAVIIDNILASILFHRIHLIILSGNIYVTKKNDIYAQFGACIKLRVRTRRVCYCCDYFFSPRPGNQYDAMVMLCFWLKFKISLVQNSQYFLLRDLFFYRLEFQNVNKSSVRISLFADIQSVRWYWRRYDVSMPKIVRKPMRRRLTSQQIELTAIIINNSRCICKICCECASSLACACLGPAAILGTDFSSAAKSTPHKFPFRKYEQISE